MMSNELENSAAFIELELRWLQRLILKRLDGYFDDHPVNFAEFEWLDPPNPKSDSSAYATILYGNHDEAQGLKKSERVILALAISPHLMPTVLDHFLIRNEVIGRRFTEFGGTLDSDDRFLPTAETAMFLLAGMDIFRRLSIYSLFAPDKPLAKNKLVTLKAVQSDSPRMSAKLLLGDTVLAAFLDGF